MKTILVVDDEPSLRALISTTLADAEYRIVEAGDGNSALRLAREELPDLLLLDWMLPGRSGIEVAERLRADPATRELPILMLTAMGQQQDRARAAGLGLCGYLTKPFSPLELIDRVRAVLG